MLYQTIAAPGEALSLEQMTEGLERYLEQTRPKRLLLIPPDITRAHSGAGPLCAYLYHKLAGQARVDILPALGSHLPMGEAELAAMYPGIPASAFLIHNWRQDCRELGQVPGEVVGEISGGVFAESIDVQLNARLLSGEYDAILSLGQVVPHEVVGMANYSKNLFVGVGGSHMIHQTHFLSALYGIERTMGRDFAPVRRVFDWAHERFLRDLPLCFAYTVVGRRGGRDLPVGFFMGPDRDAFEAAEALSEKENIFTLDHPPKTIVCTLDAEEYRSTWVGNKAIYRTRMALPDGGRLVIFAPGVRMLAEDPRMDPVLRRVGYIGREGVLARLEQDPALAANRSAAAHLIHGSSEGRFEVWYAAPLLGRQGVEEEARYRYLDWEEGQARYRPDSLTPGWNTLEGGEEVYYIDQPALGLWRA